MVGAAVVLFIAAEGGSGVASGGKGRGAGEPRRRATRRWAGGGQRRAAGKALSPEMSHAKPRKLNLFMYFFRLPSTHPFPFPPLSH
jgi:hypothetical protein